MSLADYLLDPWKAEKSHEAYAGSALAVRPAPEFATSEVVVSSLYRAVGFNDFSERSVIVLPAIRNIASAYLSARLGLNILLFQLDELDSRMSALNSSEDILQLLKAVQDKRLELVAGGVQKQYQELRDNSDHARTLACKKGIGSNLFEFARYSLGRRQTADPTLRSYDQSYILNKRGTAKSAPWVVSLGPVALLAVVHCCLRQYRGPRSVKHLSKHLGLYGIAVSVEAIGNSDLGRELRMLGLILDSPDAESGILLVPPFDLHKAEVTQ